MDTKIQEFVKLIDSAVQIAEQMATKSRDRRLSHLMSSLGKIKQNAMTGKLEPSLGKVNLGLGREVTDWIDGPDDLRLVEVIGKIETYYREKL